MRRNDIETLLRKYVGGAEMINKSKLQKVLGMSQATINKLLAEIKPYTSGGSKWYFVSDVAKILGE